MAMNPSFWRGRRVFLTGHTGFKGSWLSLWLQSLGAQVRGYALAPPTEPSLFVEADVGAGMASQIADIRDAEALRQSMTGFQPEVVIHMAAQPLVRLSYAEPVQTYQTNVMGTVNLLEAVRQTPSVRSVVNVTTDKCYENREWHWGYREGEALGGYDPYSSSKACSELVTAAYRQSFLQGGQVALASARAGNVIGGGDWARDRLIPDLVAAFGADRPAMIRNPASIRPWQHVLEPLSGYLQLAERLAQPDGASFAEAWNFGPQDSDAQPVEWIVERLVAQWGPSARWQRDGEPQPHEAGYLKLDSSKARARLGWSPRWNLATALDTIVEWHRGHHAGADVRALTLAQLARYEASQA